MRVTLSTSTMLTTFAFGRAPSSMRTSSTADKFTIDTTVVCVKEPPGIVTRRMAMQAEMWSP